MIFLFTIFVLLYFWWFFSIFTIEAYQHSDEQAAIHALKDKLEAIENFHSKVLKKFDEIIETEKDESGVRW